MAEKFRAFRGLEGNDAAVGGLAGANAGRRIFENDAIPWSEAEEFRTSQVGFRVRFAVGDIGATNSRMRFEFSGSSPAPLVKSPDSSFRPGPRS